MYSLIRLIYIYMCIDGIYQTDSGENYNEIEEFENQIVTNVGSNVTLSCTSDLSYLKSGVYWIRKGRQSDGEKVLNDGSLFLSNLKKSDTTLYMCYDQENDNLLSKVYLYVRGPPDQPTSVSIITTVQHAVITWHQKVNSEWEQKMGGAVTSIHLRYRKLNNSWIYFSHHIPPSEGEVNIYLLEPNTNYEFELWSQNKYGSSLHVSLFARTISSQENIDYRHSMMIPSQHLDAKVWLTALVAMLFVVNIFVIFMIAIYCRNGRKKPMEVNDEYSENIELVPNIIENPVCNVDSIFSEDTHSNLLHSTNKQSTFM